MERPNAPRDLTQEELAHIAEWATCPYCDQPLYVGPRGGLSVNLRCNTKHCHARFNYSAEGDHPFAGEYIGVDDSPLCVDGAQVSPEDPSGIVISFHSPIQLAPSRPSPVLVVSLAFATVCFVIDVCLMWYSRSSIALIALTIFLTILSLVYTVRMFRSYWRDRKAYRDFRLTIAALERLPPFVVEFTAGPPDRR